MSVILAKKQGQSAFTSMTIQLQNYPFLYIVRTVFCQTDPLGNYVILKVDRNSFNYYFNYIFHIVLLIDSFIVFRFKHEPLARETGQPCLTYDNKLD